MASDEYHRTCTEGMILFNKEKFCAACGTLTELKTYATSQMKADFFESSHDIETHG